MKNKILIFFDFHVFARGGSRKLMKFLKFPKFSYICKRGVQERHEIKIFQNSKLSKGKSFLVKIKWFGMKIEILIFQHFWPPPKIFFEKNNICANVFLGKKETIFIYIYFSLSYDLRGYIRRKSHHSLWTPPLRKKKKIVDLGGQEESGFDNFWISRKKNFYEFENFSFFQKSKLLIGNWFLAKMR